MKKKLLFLLMSLTIVGCNQVASSPNPSTSVNPTTSTTTIKPTSTSTGGNSGTPGVSTKLYAATIDNNCPDNYYSTCKGLKGEALKTALHNIIKGHTHFNYSNTQEFYKTIDRDPHDSSKINLIYSGTTSINAAYNKEHVWAKSHGSFDGKYPMHSDLHNLHPCNEGLNSARSNLNFAEGGDIISGYNGNNKKTSNTFEPSDFSKGDVARTIFYMAVRYEGGSGEIDLEVSPSSSSNYYNFANGATGVHGKFDDLYKWATSGQDPVDDFEVHRNNTIYSDYQKNRNPFIDHPEFIQMIYDKNYSGAGALLDNNPFEKISPEQEAKEFKAIVDAIDENNVNSKSALDDALKQYEQMSSEAKELAKDTYASLLAKIKKNNEIIDATYVNQVIEKINQIGEVTLEDKELIEECERLYNALSEEGKAKVTNYQTLVDARAKYDELYEAWLEANPEKEYTLLTDASKLSVGDTIVIAAKDYDAALSTTQKNNNRAQTEITKLGDSVELNDNVQIITLEEGKISGTYAFNVGNGYLYAASSSSNSLKTEAAISDNSSWKITIDNGVASIIAQGSNSRKTMQYNDTATLFSCYSGATQKPLCIYKGGFGSSSDTPINPPSEYTITYNAGTNGTCEKTSETVSVGSYVTLPNVTANENWSFDGWYSNINKVGNAGDKYTPTSNVTLTAQYTYNAPTEGSKITLTRDNTIGDSASSYTDGTSTIDGVAFSWNMFNGNSSIQLRSSNSNSGIVSTTTVGEVKSIEVVWNSNTTDGRTLDIYGSKSAYSVPTDLYSTDTRGTKIGSLVKGTSTVLEVSGEYSYIGMRSNSGAMYITSITIYYQ